jgi:uncharacterized protein (UPF0332 family)
MNLKFQTIQQKMNKAKSLLNEVNVLLEHEFYITAINRLYYSCYHATKALFLTEDIVVKTHSGVVAQLHQHFVMKGKFDYESASFFSRLMLERIEDDYSDFTITDLSEVLPIIEPARNYVTYVEELLNDYLHDKMQKP